MARARHRLTALRQAVVNEPKSPPTTREYQVIADIDRDTYTHHVGGLNANSGRGFDVGLGGATGHTGSTSASYYMASGIQKTGTGPNFTTWQPPYQREMLEIGAWLPSDFVTLDSGNTPKWKYEFNGRDYSSSDNDGMTYDGSLGGRAQRAYFFIDLNLASNRQIGSGTAPIPASGDTVSLAKLCLRLNAIMFHDSSNFSDIKFPNFSSTYNVDSSNIIAGSSFDDGGTYCAYKVVRGFTSTGELGDLNWLGWSGGIASSNAESDYWIDAGGSRYSAAGNTGDISDLGVSSCYGFGDGDFGSSIPRGFPPITSDVGKIFGDPNMEVIAREDPEVKKPDDPVGDVSDGPGDGGDPTQDDTREICFDVTHIVQDAIDNESNIVRIAIYRDNDGGYEAVPAAETTYQPSSSTYTPPGGAAGDAASLTNVYDQSQDDTSTPSNNGRALFHDQFRHAIRVHSSNSTSENLRPKLSYTFTDRT